MAILPFQNFQFCGGTYLAASPVVDSERSINLYPEINPAQAKSPVALIGRPGLSTFCTLPTAPVRALAAGNGRLFAIGGTHFYEVDPTSGSIITDYGAIPNSTNTTPARIVFGMVGGTAQLLLSDPSCVPNPLICYPSISGPAVNAVFNGFDLEFMDAFYFSLVDATQNGVAASAAGDGATWPGLAVIQRQTEVDQVNGLYKVNSNLWIFGQKTITPYYDTGSAGFPLALVQGATIQIGALGPPSSIATRAQPAFHILKAQNTVLWIGADDRGFMDFYIASGVLPVPISSPGIIPLVKGYGNISNARGFAYSEGGHTFAVWNFPLANYVSGSPLGATLVYDLTTKQWHERTYFNGSTEGRWLADCFASVELQSGAQNFIGDFSSGRIFKMGLEFTSDAGQPIRYTRRCPVISSNNSWLAHGSFQLDADIGSANAVLTYSNNGGLSYTGGPYTIPKIGTTAASGINTYIQHQLGRSRQRVYQVQITDGSNLIRLVDAYVDVYGSN
jgi:hypothetical protein